MQQDNINPNNTVALKYAAYISLLLMLLFLVGSVIFFRERTLFSDATHNIFRIINYNSVQVEAERYGLAITQIFPLIGARLHFPLSWIMMLYSVSFYIFFTVTVSILIFYFKEYALAVLYGLFLTIFVSDAYYYLNNEGIALLFLAFAINSRISQKQTRFVVAFPVFVVTFFLALWTHPLVMLPAIFLWFFMWFGGISWTYSRRNSIIYSVVILVLSFIKYYQGKNHGYDSGKIEMITLFEPKRLLDLFSAPQFRFFVKNCINDFWLFVLLLLAGLGVLIKNKKYILFLLTICFTGGYLLLLFITYWDVDYNKFYLEIEYMPLAIISTTPFVYFILAKLKKNHALVCISLIYFVRVIYIGIAGSAFSERIVLLENINKKMAEKKLSKVIIMPPYNDADKTLLMNWGAPAESMIISQLKNEQPQRAFIFSDSDRIKGFYTLSQDTLLGCFAKYPAANLNKFYFRLDTLSKYTVMSYPKLME
ncbi:MAG: hypothetical protein K9G49_12780 [Taibaiella sp.]|nr:hypothetical protein [Taibaiella sp.]